MSQFDYAALLQAARDSDHVFDLDNLENSSDSVDLLDIGSVLESEPDQPYTTVERKVSDAQYKVATHPYTHNEILRVPAGPGSGKTYAMAARIAHLMGNGIKPNEILVLSMANRSVDALRHSLAGFIGPEQAASVDISTFHLFCGLLLDQYQYKMESQKPRVRRRVFDKLGWERLARLFLSKSVTLSGSSVDGTVTPAQMDKLLASVTNGGLTPERAAQQYRVNAEYVRKLVEYLDRHGVLRYNDLITGALHLIRYTASRSRNGYMAFLIPRIAKYRVVFVDEFQDMHPLLLSIVDSVVSYPTLNPEADNKENDVTEISETPGDSRTIPGNKHLVVAGDPNQAIYEFLGATNDSIAKLPEIFPRMSVVDIPLSESFRCSQPILDAAVDASLHLTDRPATRAVSTRNSAFSCKPILVRHENQESELHFVADEIIRLICTLGGLICPKDIAVLSRTNSSAEQMQSILDQRFGVKSNKIAQGNVWVSSPMHIYRDVLSVIAGDADSLFSLLNILPILDTARGSQTRASKVLSESVACTEINFLELFMFDDLASDLPKLFLRTLYRNCPNLLAAIAEFLNHVQIERDNLQKMHQESPASYGPVMLAECLARTVKLPSIRSHIFGTQTSMPFSTYLESFNNSLHHSYDGYLARSDLQDMTFVDYFLQTYDNEVPAVNTDLVLVSTIHAAKGMEFPVVFITGMSQYSSYWDKTLAGALCTNLLYVALTRARDLVYLGTALNREAVLPAIARHFLWDLPTMSESPTDFEESEASGKTTQNDLGASPIIEPEILKLRTAEKHLYPSAAVATGLRLDVLLGALAQDLCRPLPLAAKLARGTNLFRQLVQKPNHVTTTVQARPKSGFPTPIPPSPPHLFLGAARQGRALMRRV